MGQFDKKVAYVRAAKNTRDHVCHAEGCEVLVKPAYFMCPKHWRMVPRALQMEIWKYFNPGQEEGEASVSREYLDAHQRAVAAVAAAEGRAL